MYSPDVKTSPYYSKASFEVTKRYGDRQTQGHRPGETIPEVNTGLFMFPSTPKTIHFFEVLIQGVFLQQWKRRDQMYVDGYSSEFMYFLGRIIFS
jgi:hypothetical protein